MTTTSRAPRIPDPLDAPAIRSGVLAPPGGIACAGIAALLDLTIHQVSIAHLVLGAFTATGTLTGTGGDASETIAVTGPQGAIDTLASTMLAKTPCSASISGTAARPEVDSGLCQSNSVRLVDLDDHDIDRYETPSRGRDAGGRS